MFEADWKPSSWDDEDGQRRHLDVKDPKTATVDKTATKKAAPAPAAKTAVKKTVKAAPTTTDRRAALIK